MPTFSAALLAGGTSKRMGRDKALLELPGTDQLLWQRQWRVLEELAPEEMFWSGPLRPSPPTNARIILDQVANAGPLAGIAACLESLCSDLLVVLAVDLPQMDAAFLRRLLSACTPSCGVVIRHDDFFEPLAAVYPKSLHDLATAHLAQGRYALQDFLREAVKQEAMVALPLREGDAPLFKNVNAASDI